MVMPHPLWAETALCPAYSLQAVGFWLGFSIFKGWFDSWVPDSVFSAGNGRSSDGGLVFYCIWTLEESLSGAVDSEVHICVADVVKSFDTVDRGVLDYVLSRLGLPAWFRHAYFEYHAKVRLRFKLSCGVGQAWTRDGGIPQGMSPQHDFYRFFISSLV